MLGIYDFPSPVPILHFELLVGLPIWSSFSLPLAFTSGHSSSRKCPRRSTREGHPYSFLSHWAVATLFPLDRVGHSRLIRNSLPFSDPFPQQHGKFEVTRWLFSNILQGKHLSLQF